MAFCFKRRESVAKAIRRLGRERTQEALNCVKDCRQAEAIHCVRKDIKKTRAVLKLVRADLPTKAYRRQTKLLREAAHHLAPTRDAYVITKALKDLTAHFKGQLAPGALRHIRMPLQNALQEETKRFAKQKTARSVKRLLRRTAKEFDHLAVDRKGWKAIGAGVNASYREGRRAYQAALEDSKPENLHEWRTRAKELWYQVGLLRRIWPEQMDATAEELEALGEFLGDDHDLFMLQQAIGERRAGDSHVRELEILRGLIDERQRELRAEAMALGARFYTEKPSAFCNRLAGYWRIWRRKKKSSAVAA
jgi:CHAD domain-containing protein